MTPELKASIINTRVARALIKAQGMTALNMQRQACGNSMAYDDGSFFKLIEDEGIDDNSITALWREW